MQADHKEVSTVSKEVKKEELRLTVLLQEEEKEELV